MSNDVEENRGDIDSGQDTQQSPPKIDGSLGYNMIDYLVENC